jgi:hypothetical protein
MRKLTIGGLLAATAFASLVLASGGAAQNLEPDKNQKLYRGTISLVRTVNSSGADTWTGVVHFKNKRCRAGRRIRLDQGAPVGQIGLSHVAVTHSNSSGAFSFTFEPLPGGYEYSANARPARVSSRHTSPVKICDGAVSFSVFVP